MPRAYSFPCAEGCKCARHEARHVQALRGRKHPPDCGHCAAIRGKPRVSWAKGIQMAGRLGPPIYCSKGCGQKFARRAISRHERVCTGDIVSYGVDWHCIRRFIYKRDGYACQDCGKPARSGKPDHTLVAHHIVLYREVRRHEEPNLITLCRKCHRNWHLYAESVERG